jgi:hypothetical protein
MYNVSPGRVRTLIPLASVRNGFPIVPRFESLPVAATKYVLPVAVFVPAFVNEAAGTTLGVMVGVATLSANVTLRVKTVDLFTPPPAAVTVIG